MKHIIRKHITRKINTGSYENISISVDIEREIECSPEVLQNFLDEVTSIVIEDFKHTTDQVLEELGLSEKKAWGESVSNKKDFLNEGELKEILGE